MTSQRVATLRQLLPPHRLHVVAKTPLIVALGVYLSGGTYDSRTVGATVLLSAALWAALYALNEATDLTHENRLTVPRFVWVVLAVLPIAFCAVAAGLSLPLAIPFVLMVVSQLAYCVPPMRLKRHWWAIVLLSGTLNPILRLQCGVHWGTHSLSLLVYLAFICLHLGSALRARVLLRDRDQQRGYSVAPPGSETVGILCTTIGFVAAFVVYAQGVLPPIFGLFLMIAAVFAVYAWSGRVTSMSSLRRGWLWFAILSVVALAMLFSRS